MKSFIVSSNQVVKNSKYSIMKMVSINILFVSQHTYSFSDSNSYHKIENAVVNTRFNKNFE